MGKLFLTNATYDDGKIREASPEIIYQCLGIKVYSNPALYKVDTLTFDHPEIDAIELDHGGFFGHYFHPDNVGYNKKGLNGKPKLLQETLNVPYRKWENGTLSKTSRVVYLRTNKNFTQANFIMWDIINDESKHLYSSWICENNKKRTLEHFVCFERKDCLVFNKDPKTGIFIKEEIPSILIATTPEEREKKNKEMIDRANENMRRKKEGNIVSN